MRLRAGVASDRGLVRQTNEDFYLVRRGLYAVCDGMGGARAGEVASEMACRELSTLDPSAAGAEELRAAIGRANEAIVRLSIEEERLLGMGTTLTAVLAGDRTLNLAHVGDSRAYLFRDETLSQLTDDHSWVGEMVRRGELSPAQAAVHPHRSVITRALGTVDDADPDLFEVPVETGDRVLICSDGLTGMVSDPEIAAILGRSEEPAPVAQALVEAALSRGGEDNVTVVVIDVLSVDDEGGDGRGGDSSREAGDGTADEILLGPIDAEASAGTRSGRARRPGAGVRGRLEGRVGPFLRSTAQPGGVDAADTTVMPAVTAEAELPQAVTPPAKRSAARRRGWTKRKWVISVIAIVAVLAIGIIGFTVFNSTVYYVGVSDGTVVLYNGLPGSILGIALSSVIERGTVAYDTLPPYLKARIDSRDLVSKEKGQLFLRSLSYYR